MHTLVQHAVRRLCIAAALSFAASSWGASVSPVNYPGNVSTCGQATLDPSSLGVNPLLAAQDGRITFDPGNGGPVPTGSYHSPDGVVFDITVNQDGGGNFHIDWSATFNGAPFGIDAVVVKGGPGFNAYIYDPELNPPGPEGDASSDTNLVPPQGFSHILFCYDYHLLVSKTAVPHFTRTHNWTLGKSVTPASLNLFKGDSGDVTYTVSATEDATPPADSFFTISGAVVITNPWPFAANITAIMDQLNDGSPVSLNCATGLLAAGASENCSYSQAIATPIKAGDARINTVRVTTDPSSQVSGGSASAVATFSTPTTENNTTITVTDSDLTAGGPWTFASSNSITYGKTFDCAGQGSQRTLSYDFKNTVSDGIGDTAGANVHVDCYSLAVTKTAGTTYTRTWAWNIAKNYVSPALNVDTNNDGANDALLFSTSQTLALSYNVVVSATSTDSAWGAAGSIVIGNNDPTRDATLVQVVDSLPTALGAVGVNCGGATVVPAGSQLTCTYAAALPGPTSQVNTATATQQNYHFTAGGATQAGTTNYSGTAPVVFGAPSTLVDNCVGVADLFNGSASSTLAGSVCATPGSFAKTYGYTANFTWDPSLGTCRTYAVPNVASLVTNTTGTANSSTATINVTNQDCLQGCTLTQGYWKTHSKYGPAKSDPTWNDIVPNGADTPFLDAGHPYGGKTWYQAFWTAPAGNAYWQLAHQFEAAVLNGFNGAAQPAQVQDAINQSFTWFGNPAYTPTYIGALKSSNPLRQQFIAAAALLDLYNNGNYPGGPPHCSEDATSSSSP